MLFWLALTGMLIWRFVVYEPPQPVMGKAGVLTLSLYTSDAADERSSVDLGGGRIIKKKKKKNK